MKVLFWSEKYLPDIGGVEVFGAHLMKALIEKGHTFSVITCRSNTSQPEHEVLDGIDVYRFNFHKPLYGKNLAEITRISREIAELKQRITPDLIHMNTVQPSIFYQIHTSRSYNCPTLVTIHSPPTFVDGPHSLFGRLVREATYVTAVSDATRTALLEVVPEIEPTAVTVHNGLEPPGLVPAPLPFEPVHVVCIGRVVEEKGFDVALRAFQIFLSNHPTARMTIAGDGAAREDLEALSESLDLRSSVDFVGIVDRDRVPDLMNTATMVVVPSRWEEPFGLVALQGSQVGRPVIASRVGGLPEVVTDGKTGLLVEPEDPDALVEAMHQIAADPDLAHRLGGAGYERAMTRFTLEHCADRYNQIYLQVIEEASVTSDS